MLGVVFVLEFDIKVLKVISYSYLLFLDYYLNVILYKYSGFFGKLFFNFVVFIFFYNYFDVLWIVWEILINVFEIILVG